MNDNLLEAAKQFLAIYDEITNSILAERLGSRSDTEMRKDANEAIAELRVAALRRAAEEEEADRVTTASDALAPPPGEPAQGVTEALRVRQVAINDVLDLLTGHELYRYRPKAFNGFIEYARTTLATAPEGSEKQP